MLVSLPWVLYSKLPLGASNLPLGASKLSLGASKLPLGASEHPLEASKHPLEASKHPLGASKHPFWSLTAMSSGLFKGRELRDISSNRKDSEAVHP